MKKMRDLQEADYGKWGLVGLVVAALGMSSWFHWAAGFVVLGGGIYLAVIAEFLTRVARGDFGWGDQ
jgi:hypothetical protein